jgi:hypothetical protein
MALFPYPVVDLQDRSEVTEPERLRVTLARGVLLFRWAMVAFMTAVAATGEPFRRPMLAWTSIGVAAAWTTVLTVQGHRWQTSYMLVDFAVCAWLLVASGVVVPVESVVSGRPFFAQGYPVSAAVMWGVARGPGSGLAAGAALSLFLIAVRPLNGVSLDELEARQVATLAGAVLNYIVAAGAVGLVARLLVESAPQIERRSSSASARRGWPNASESGGRSTTRFSSRWPSSTSAAASSCEPGGSLRKGWRNSPRSPARRRPNCAG